MDVRVSARPLHLSTGKGLGLAFSRNFIRIFWAHCPCLWLPCCPSVLLPLFLRRSGFGGGYPVTNLLFPSRTPDTVPVPSASPGKSSPLLSSYICRPRLPGPRPPGMSGKPYPQVPEVFLQDHPVKYPCQHVERGLEPHWISGGYHPVVRVKKLLFRRQLYMSPFRPPSTVVPSPDSLS